MKFFSKNNGLYVYTFYTPILKNIFLKTFFEIKTVLNKYFVDRYLLSYTLDPILSFIR